MTTVCCVLWGDKFSTDYVHHLKAGVERNSTVDHEFVCYSDRQIEGVKTVILNEGMVGWWNKLQLFDGRIDGRGHDCNQSISGAPSQNAAGKCNDKGIAKGPKILKISKL